MTSVKTTDSAINETLKSICCSNGWCYGLFWGFDQSNSLLLTLKDAYYEEKLQALAHNMLHQEHTLGGGLIGQVALSQNHKWIYSESHQDIMPDPYDQSQNDSDIFSQFVLGIKTVALISVEPWGVLQLGSTEKIPEEDGLEGGVRESFKAAMIRTFDSLFSCEPLSKLPTDEFDELLFDSSGLFNFSGCQTLSAGVDLSYQQAKYIPLFEHSCFDPTYGYKDSKPASALFTLDDLFQENDHCLIDDGLHHFDGFVHLPNASVITDSTTSSITDRFGSSNSHKALKRSELDRQCSRPAGQDDPFSNVVDGSSFTTDASRFISEKNVGASNSLFSRLGLDQILDGVPSSFGQFSYTKNRFEDQSAKRRKTNSNSWTQSQEKAQNNLEVKSEDASTKEQGGSFITEMCSERTNSSSKRQLEEITAKGGKKKAKPGTKPRPKDRQMIQDRLAELRHLIPNGEKMSIDRLLERTIKHLNYMQSLTKHADVLQQNHKPKADVKYNFANGGATWAYEVGGDQSMVCPLIVEDLNTPGQMLIEILCDEQGFFLEIAEIIRSFGLTVLKGTMELRETKIWAHFLAEAEANRRVTRHEIFSSLIQLLQMGGGENAVDPNNDCFGKINRRDVSSEAYLFDNYNKTCVSFPMNLAGGNNPLHCASVRQCS